MKNRIQNAILNSITAGKPLRLFILCCITNVIQYGYGQTYVNQPMTGTPAAGVYYNNNVITLSPNFSFTASQGYTLSIEIIHTDCVPLGSNPSTAQNFIMTSTPRIKGMMSNADLANRGTCDLMQTVQYFDGIGRPLQTVMVKGSAQDNDVVAPHVYDAMGREATVYLPYALTPATVSDGSYKTNALAAGAGQSQFYAQPPGGVSQIASPQSVTAFEPSPLNRVTEQGAPGAAWQLSTSNIATAGHTVRTTYTANDQSSAFSSTYTAGTANPGSRIAALYTVTINADMSRTLVRNNNATYAPGELHVTIVQNENNQLSGDCLGATEEYKDIEGHVVLKRTYNLANNAVQMLSTYYVYDNLGNLCFVLPPASNADTALPSQAVLSNLCYQYVYDYRNRLVQKTIPGKQVEYMVYNTLDKVVASQDGNMRAGNQWLFTKYDALGRVIITGLWSSGSSAVSQTALQATVNTYNTLWETTTTAGNGYTIAAWPSTAILSYLTVNYYDGYTVPGMPSKFSSPAGAVSQPTGMLTASQTAVLDPTGSVLWSGHYYDGLGREIQAYGQHYLGGTVSSNNYDAISTTYNFTNAPTSVTRQHFNAVNASAPLAVTIANTYIYDHIGRKVKTWEQITNGSNAPNPANKYLVSQVVYNEIGQVMQKQLHSTDSVNFLQNIAYTYNERGWLTKINDPTVTPTATQLFAEQINYNQTQYGTLPQYNGNIAEQVYNASFSGLQHFTYTYDALNRLTNGNSSEGLNETNIGYDLNGNLKTLTRGGQGAATLTYNYYNNNNSNQLQTVYNGSPVFRSYGAYDANGNAPGDGTGKTFTYNLLNLPQTVTATGVSITYTYDAGGTKLRKVSNGSPTDYISGIQYKTDAATIDFIMTEEGRAINNVSSYNYEYTLTDHLGNNRVTFDMLHGKASEDRYYPFGLDAPLKQNSPPNNYLYNKKELQEELQQYDYGARFYDPVIARWNTIDPMAEKYRRWSPYNYVDDDPIRLTDPDGDSIRTTGSATATASMKQVAETGMGGNATMTQAANGNWTLSTLTDDQALNMTAEQADMYNSLSTMISDPKTASYNLVDGNDAVSQHVFIGDNGAAPAGVSATPGVHTIDMGDIKNMGTTGILTGQGALMHEVSEGYQIQTKGVNANTAHFDTGIPTESAVDGVQINLTRRSAPTINSNGNILTISVPVTVNGVQRTVIITFTNGNILPGGVQNNIR